MSAMVTRGIVSDVSLPAAPPVASSLARLLELYSGQMVSYAPNPGNRGDGLIHLGTVTLFKRFGVQFRTHQGAGGGDVLFVGGGGSWYRDHFNDARRRMEQALLRFDRLIVLPSTFDDGRAAQRSFYSSLPARITFFCRGKTSQVVLRRYVSKPEDVMVAHDMAFYVPYAFYAKQGAGALLAFRRDNEGYFRGTIVPGPRSFDVSRAFIAGRREKIDGYLTAEGLLEEVASYESVHTDRLHVAIAGAMLGKETHLYPSASHKWLEVYELSLSSLGRVRLHGVSALLSMMAKLGARPRGERVLRMLAAAVSRRLRVGRGLVSQSWSARRR